MSPCEPDAALAPPDSPVLQLVLDVSGRASVDGRPLDIPEDTDPQASLLAAATRRAADLGRPLRVRAVDPAGTWHLVAYPDGEVSELPPEVLQAEDGDEQDAPRDEVPNDEPWHLRVHPNGIITPVTDVPTSIDEDYVPLPRPDEEPRQASDNFTAPPPAAEPEPEPEPAAEPEPISEEPEPPAQDHIEQSVEPPVTPAPPQEPEEEWYRLDLPSMSPPSSAPSAPTEPPANPATIKPPESAVLLPPAPADPSDADTTPSAPDDDAPQRDLDHTPDAIVHGFRSTASVPPPRSRRKWIPAVLATTLGAVTVTAIAVAATGGDITASLSRSPGGTSAASDPSASAGSGAPRSGAAQAGAPAVSAPPSLAAVPATLDIGAPPGYSAKPAWALPVASSSSTTVSADGKIVTLTADRQIAVVDAVSGAVRWHARTPSQAAGPYLSQIEGRPVVAMLTTSRLLYWPLTDQGVPAGGTSATEVALPAGAAVTWAGPSPLVTFADGSAGVVRGGTVQRVSLPTRARPLAADGVDVLAVAEADWVRQTAGQGPATPRRLAAPEGATGSSPIRVENVGGGFLGAMWAGNSGPVVAVYEARNGDKLVEATFPKDVDFTTAPAVRETGSDRTVIGTALFEPSQRNLSILSSTFTPVALAPGHVYANDVSGAVADLQIDDGRLNAVRFPARKPTIPAGVVNSGSRRLAVVVVPSGSGWVMYALPTT